MTKASLRKAFTSELAKETADYNEFLDLVEEMTNFVGKPLDGRTMKKLSDKWEYLGLAHNSQVQIKGVLNTHTICWKQDAKDFNLGLLEKADSIYSRGSKNRIEKLSNILDNEERFNKVYLYYKKHEYIVKLIAEIKTMSDDEKMDSFTIPNHHAIIEDVYKSLKDVRGVYKWKDIANTLA